MRRSIKKAGWFGATFGAVIGVVTGAVYVIVTSPPYPHYGKEQLGSLLIAAFFGCIGALGGAALIALTAFVIQTGRSDQSNSNSIGQPQDSAPQNQHDD